MQNYLCHCERVSVPKDIQGLGIQPVLIWIFLRLPCLRLTLIMFISVLTHQVIIFYNKLMAYLLNTAGAWRQYTAYFIFVRYIWTGRDAPQSHSQRLPPAHMGETTPLATTGGTPATQWLPKTALLSIPQEHFYIRLYLIYMQSAVLLIRFKR